MSSVLCIHEYVFTAAALISCSWLLILWMCGVFFSLYRRYFYGIPVSSILRFPVCAVLACHHNWSNERKQRVLTLLHQVKKNDTIFFVKLMY